jgi:anti-sigma regulatory factor (Ser/Thr protein kinase)
MEPSAQPPLRLHPEISELSSLVTYIESFGEEHGIHPTDTMAFALAAEELFANTLNHSHPPATTVEFSLACSDGVATATYSDDSPAFDPTLHPVPDTNLPAGERSIGGLGIHLVRRTMPVFRYARLEDRNLITFGRPLKQPAK